jgi:hypothetical protein
MIVFVAYEDAPLPEWRNWQTRQLEGLVRLISGAGSSPVSGIACDQWRPASRIAVDNGIALTLGSSGGRIQSMRSLIPRNGPFPRQAGRASFRFSPCRCRLQTKSLSSSWNEEWDGTASTVGPWAGRQAAGDDRGGTSPVHRVGIASDRPDRADSGQPCGSARRGMDARH